jgi:hypothetical protein
MQNLYFSHIFPLCFRQEAGATVGGNEKTKEASLQAGDKSQSPVTLPEFYWILH